eukprot:TRINITY_DN76709_c0_g1_i1.p1 TRINITY_DN76709_c0_g1~~TRINITY_DN76709_c0_g1_i1.p1  ORF type:complete len:381 (+),score=44.42 TRINITY_DN76709_c0_g1_i1:83-1225(+)
MVVSRATDALLDVLSDPSEGAGSSSKPRDHAAIRQRAMAAFAGLGFAGLATLAMTLTAGHCRDTTSGLPFSKIDHEGSSTYIGLMVLSCTTYVIAAAYPLAVLQKARPQFLHVAGSFLLVNSASLFCLVITIWGGCNSVAIVRVPTAVLSLVGLAATSFLIQYCILAKVEALSSARGDAQRTARWWFHVMLNPGTIGVGIVSSILPLGIASKYINEKLMTFQMLFILCFLVALGCFTHSAVSSMLRCVRSLDDPLLEMSNEMRRRLRRLVVLNAAATGLANGATFLWFVTILGVWALRWDLSWFFLTYAIDNACHTCCALFLSGLLEAVGGRQADEAHYEPESNSALHCDVDVLKQLKQAGQLVSKDSIENDHNNRLRRR